MILKTGCALVSPLRPPSCGDLLTESDQMLMLRPVPFPRAGFARIPRHHARSLASIRRIRYACTHDRDWLTAVYILLHEQTFVPHSKMNTGNHHKSGSFSVATEAIGPSTVSTREASKVQFDLRKSPLSAGGSSSDAALPSVPPASTTSMAPSEQILRPALD